MAKLTILEALQLSLNATKKYVDDKTEILPVKQNYTIFENSIPEFQEQEYIFNNLQNVDMIPYSAFGELIISFNDGTEDITKTATFRNFDDNYVDEIDYIDDFEIHLSYSEDTNSFVASVNKWVLSEDGHEETIPCTVTKGTFVCSTYSNLIEDYLIEDIEYKKITNVPIELRYLTDGKNETLKSKEYYDLYDNSFIWDMNKINERLDENSGVTQNTFSTTYSGKVINVNQKDSEGIGFGQLVPITRDKNITIFVRAEKDVIIKVYNPNTKELIFTMEDIYINSFRYAKYSIPFHKVRNIDNIFIAFTIKDTLTDSSSNNRIYDLMVIDEFTFLKKKDILTKTNTKEYTPTEDYNPATKKYVDDKVAGVNASTITGLATVATSGSYNDLTNKPIIPSIEGLATETYVNNKVSGLVDSAPEALNTLNELATALGNDANFATTISNQIGLKANSTDLATVATSGSYNDLSDKPTIPAAYTHPVSHPASMITGLHTVATSGDYNDLNNKPTIPTKTSQLTNDSGFITSIPAEYITDTYLNNKLSGMPKSLAGHDGAQVLSYIDKHNVLERENMVDKAFQVFTSLFYSTSTPTSGDISNLSVVVVDFANTIMNACTEFGEDIFLYFDFIFDSPIKFVVMPHSSSNMFLMIIDDGRTKVALQIEFTGDGTGQYTRTSTELVTSNKIATVATSGDYNDLTNKPSIPTVTNDLTNELKTNYDAAYTHSTSAHAPSNAQKNSDITKSEIEAKLTGNITTHTHRQYLTEHQSLVGYAKTADLSTVATSGSYNDLSDKPTIPTAYTHPSSHPASMITGLAKVATSGSYNDLTNKPTIPTVTNDLTNALKSNYDTAYTHSQSAHAPVNAQKNSDITKAEIEAKLTGDVTTHTHSQYLTEHQSLTGYATEEFVNNRLSSLQIVPITQADYDALETKDPNTLYLITTSNAGSIDSNNHITLSSDLPSGRYTLKYEDENGQPLSDFEDITIMEV